jgi:hypothetical protein
VPLIVFLGGRGVGTEVLAVPLAAFDKMHVLEASAARFGRIEHVAQHGNVLLDAFDTAFAELGPRRVEHVGRFGHAFQRVRDARRIQQIDAEVAHAAPRRRRSAAQPDHLPPGRIQMLDELLRNGTRRAGYDCDTHTVILVASAR